MTALVDVVNFNADGSCVSARRWLQALSGGAGSELCQWLQAYVDTSSAICLGIVGATLADIAQLNPEAIAVINAHPELFQVIVRPFAHDIALLRTDFGFGLNLDYGIEAARREFREVAPYYLPPEFMLTNRQLGQLSERGLQGTFINPARFPEEIQARVPDRPYVLTGVGGVEMPCIPFDGALTEGYLHALQQLSADLYLGRVARWRTDIAFGWRDGESVLLVPDGVARERRWLEECAGKFERLSLTEALRITRPIGRSELRANAFRSYPVHSFSAWMKEFRMLGYLRDLERAEARLPEMSQLERTLWLQAINSDVLSAVEKASPTVKLAPFQEHGLPDQVIDFPIPRTERGFEGEEFLYLLGRCDAPETAQRLREDAAPHIVKLRARLRYLRVDA